jgi:hypothetical protein
MKLQPITGKVYKVSKVRDVKKGFSQVVIINKPAEKNQQGYVLSKEQWFVVHIYSNKKDDSRFIADEKIPHAIGLECTAICYLDGQRWQGKNDFEYTHKINLDQWQK